MPRVATTVLAALLCAAPLRAYAKCGYEHLEKIAAFHGTVVKQTRLKDTWQREVEKVISQVKVACKDAETDDECAIRAEDAHWDKAPEDAEVYAEVEGTRTGYKAVLVRDGVRQERTAKDEMEIANFMKQELLAGRGWVLERLEPSYKAGTRKAVVKTSRWTAQPAPAPAALTVTLETSDPYRTVRSIQMITRYKVTVERYSPIDGEKADFTLRCPDDYEY